MKRKSVAFGVSIIKNIFNFMKYDTGKFIIIISFIAMIIIIIIAVLKTEITADKNKVKVKINSVNIEKILQGKR